MLMIVFSSLPSLLFYWLIWISICLSFKFGIKFKTQFKRRIKTCEKPQRRRTEEPLGNFFFLLLVFVLFSSDFRQNFELKLEENCKFSIQFSPHSKTVRINIISEDINHPASELSKFSGERKKNCFHYLC